MLWSSIHARDWLDGLRHGVLHRKVKCTIFAGMVLGGLSIVLISMHGCPLGINANDSNIHRALTRY